jgi:hypothetical protein
MTKERWSFERRPTSEIDRPEGLGDTHFEFSIEECVLPYLSKANAKILEDRIQDAVKSRSAPFSARILIGDESISVERRGRWVVIGSVKTWSFDLNEAERLWTAIKAA